MAESSFGGVGFLTGLSVVASAAWTPSSITNALDWIDGSDNGKITSSGGLVSAVAGQMSVLTWSQATDNNKPKIGVTTINGKQVLSFGTQCDATNKFRYMDSGATSYATTGCHYWAVIQATAYDSPSQLSIFMDGTSSQRAAMFWDLDGGNRPLSLFAGTYPNRSTSMGDTSLHLVVGNFVSGGTSKFYVDGVEVAVGDPGSKTPLVSRIGGDASTITDNQFSGHLPACGLGTSAMGTTDRGNLLTWAQSTWGTP